MSDPTPRANAIISDHALLRYLQRVKGVDVAQYRRMAHGGASDYHILQAIERVTGCDIEALRGRLLTPSVQAAVNIGAAGVVIGGARFKIKAGKVVTAFSQDFVRGASRQNRGSTAPKRRANLKRTPGGTRRNKKRGRK